MPQFVLDRLPILSSGKRKPLIEDDVQRMRQALYKSLSLIPFSYSLVKIRVIIEYIFSLLEMGSIGFAGQKGSIVLQILQNLWVKRQFSHSGNSTVSPK